MIPYYFKQYPMGMGKAFYDTRILVDELNFSVNNCHNVFLNEMLHYSTPVGILYCVLLLFFPIKTIVKSSHKFRDIIVLICLLIPLSFDMSMNDTILPIYTMILYCGFACYNN